MPLDDEIQQALHSRAETMPVRKEGLRERIRQAAAAQAPRRWLTEPLQFALAVVLLVGLAAGGFLMSAHTREPAATSSGRYLAIVDARGDKAGGQVHILDLESQSIVGTISADAPDGIFLPDGNTLVIGTPQGVTWYSAPTWQPSRTVSAAFHEWWISYPEQSAYALSPDGTHLYSVVYDPTTPPGGEGRLAFQDVDLKGGTTASSPIPTCASRLLTQAPSLVYLFCANSEWSGFRLTNGKLEQFRGGTLWYDGTPFGKDRSLATEFLSADGHVVALFQEGVIAIFDPRPNDGAGPVSTSYGRILEDGRVIPFHQAALSPDGQTLYVGTAARPCPNGGCDVPAPPLSLSADRIEAYSTKTWARTATLPVSHPFTDIAVSPDGKTFITVSSADRTVSFIDAATGKELKALTNVGTDPTRFITGPQPLLP